MDNTYDCAFVREGGKAESYLAREFGNSTASGTFR